MRGPDLLRLGLITIALQACNSVSQARPSVAMETPNPNYLQPIPTHTPNMNVLTPGWVKTQQVSTAEAVATKGVDGLVEDGMPIETIRSQRHISIKWEFNYKIGDIEFMGGSTGGCTSTLVKSPVGEGMFIVTGGHCISVESVREQLASLIAEQNKHVNTELGELSMAGLEIDGFSIKNVGVDIVYKDDDDIAVIYFDKESVDSAEWEKMQSDAIGFDQIDFNGDVLENDLFFAYFMPENTNFDPITIQDAKLLQEDGVQILNIVVPGLSTPGASGGGIFKYRLSDNKVLLYAVVHGTWIDDPLLYDRTVVSRLANSKTVHLETMFKRAKENLNK